MPPILPSTRIFLLYCLTLSGLAGAGKSPPSASQIGRWERFEIELTNPTPYSDPYNDVDLDVVFTAPGGEEIVVPGFYDGGKTWRARCLPHLTGGWRYRAMFSDGSPGATGTFRVRNSDLPGPLRSNRANPIWFSGDVVPVLVRGLHVGDRFFAANWPDAKRQAFLEWFNAQGYNLLSVASHYLNRDVEGRGRGWDTPQLWPLDAREYRKLERLLNELEARRIYVYPFAGSFGQSSNYPTDPREQERYIRYSMARLCGYWNIVLNVAGPEPNKGPKNWMEPEEVTRLGQILAGANRFGHSLSVHNKTGDDPYRDSDWTTFGTMQGPKTLDIAELSAGLLRNHHASKPLLAQETLWSGNIFHIRRNGADYSNEALRRNAYVINFSAAALVYGDFNGDSSSGFSGTMDLSLRNQENHDIIKTVWDFFEKVPYFDLKPRQDLVSQGYCLAQPGRIYLVYLENGGSVNVAVEGGPFFASWINGRDPTHRRLIGITEDGQGFHAPDASDWILQLTRTDTALADQIHLSWQQDPETTLTITWHTMTGDNPAVVEYRPVGGMEWREAQGESLRSPGRGWLHRTTLTDLIPGTAYEYRVSHDRGLKEKMSPPYRTKTAPGINEPFSAAFIADIGLDGRIDGNATGSRRVMKEVLRDAPNFIIGGGDYAYANRDLRFSTVGDAIDEWFNQWQPALARYPLMAQYGNHEDLLVERYTDWADRFAHPSGSPEGKDYSFNIGEVHFVGLYVPLTRVPAERLAWLEQDLRQARADGSDWIVVFQHQPIFAHGRSHPASPSVRADLAPILERYQVDLHLSTHDQNYERTYPLTGVPDDLHTTSSQMESYRQGDGVIYVKVSPAGKKSEIGNEFSRFTEDQHHFVAVRETGFHHYALVKLERSGELKVEVFRLADQRGPKERIDTFVIRRN